MSHLLAAAASPRFGPFHVPPHSPMHTPHASPHITGVNSSHHHRHHAHSSALVQSLSNVMWHSADSKTPCPHIHEGIDEAACLNTIRKPDSWCCEACETSNGIRMCLCCGSCACERHSYAHFERFADHRIALQLNAETKPVFCYECRCVVKEDNDEANIEHIRSVLEDVQTLNVDILCKTTRSGRRRIETSPNQATAAQHAATSDDAVVRMVDISTGDSLPADNPRLTLSASAWARVKLWHHAMPYLSRKAQALRRSEDKLRTCLFRWRNRTLVGSFVAWRDTTRANREERKQRPPPRRSTRTMQQAAADADLIMQPLDLAESEHDTEDVTAPTPKKKKPLLAVPRSDRQLRGHGHTASTDSTKRSRSEERHRSGTDRNLRDAPSDDLLSRRRAATTLSSPALDASPSPPPAKPLKSAAAIKLSPGIMGLRNLGNTCYMNSVLQALSLTDLFTRYYVDCVPKLLPPIKYSEKTRLNARAAKTKRKSTGSDDEEESSSDDEEDHSSLSRDFADLLTTLWNGQRIVFTPDHFLQTVWTLYERFRGFRQQDAQELVMFLLNQLSKEQETQMPQQSLDAKFQHPALVRAQQEIRRQVEQAHASGSARKRKKDGDRNNQSPTNADDEEPPTNRRRSHRATTVISTASSMSVRAQEAAQNQAAAETTVSRASSPSLYATPLPPSTLASIQLPPTHDTSATNDTTVPRIIVSREHDFIVQNFAGVLRSEIRCTVCQRKSASESDFLGVISVQIPPKGFLAGEDDDETPPSSQTERHATLHHSASTSQLAGGSTASLNTHIAPPSTFLSVSRSLHHSRSDQTLASLVQSTPPSPGGPSCESAASISARNRVRHDKTSVTLQKCLAFTFNQPEVLDGANAYFCDGACKKKVRAEKYQVIQAVPPKYLFIHIVRTVYDMTTFSSKKDQTHISFPLADLDLAPFLTAEARQHAPTHLYDLYAVVNHHGRGLNEGHFTNFGYSADQECWLLFNDARVNVVAPEKVAESQAYLLFFRRKDITTSNAPNATPAA